MQSMPSAELMKGKRHFEVWRSNRTRHSPIPERLWKLAVSHVRRYGLNRVSREFQLSYTKLKEKCRELGEMGESNALESRFVELAFPAERLSKAQPSGRVRLVLERVDGSRLSLEGEQWADWVEKVINGFSAR